MENFIYLTEIYTDGYTTTYEAYDKVKKCWCYLEIPNIETSWKFSVTY